MTEIRNPDGRLVCRIDMTHGNIEILEKGWITIIRLETDGKVSVTHCQKS
jgi:hypothetical protein